MGFFKKLFEKKVCDICGGEIGLLGNRKLEDGNCCKNCAGKLSPWFEERRHSTVQEIKDQLALREANKELVRNFKVSRVFGENWELQVDEGAGRFLIARTNNIIEENPDVLSFSQITAVEYDFDEDRSEEMTEDKDGNKVSYNPRRYRFQYDFYITIKVSHPYFDEMRFSVNRNTIEVFPPASRGIVLLNNDGKKTYEFQKYDGMSNEIRDYLLKKREENEARAEANTPTAAPESSAAIPAICPNCGAPAEGRKFCESCGSKLI